MNRRVRPLKPLQAEQANAADPAVHAALSASAGTGKTRVVMARVLRLLLQGAAPETILCLTFTRSGAAEMANRIAERLAAWVRMKPSELGSDLVAIRADPGPQTREAARRLFARVLDAPGGMRIQTIHSFAQALLASFPVEAGITPGFEPIEGRAEQELARTTLARLLAGAEASGDSGLIGDVECLSLRLGEEAAVTYLTRCAAAAEALAGLGAADAIEPALRRAMNLPDEPVEEFLAAHCADERFECDLLKAIAAANRQWGTGTGLGVVDTVERWLAMDGASRAAALPDLAPVVFTGSGDIRKVQAGQRKADPDYEEHVERLAASIGKLLSIQNASRLAEDVAAGLRAGQAFAAAYTRAKRAAGVADFNDLIGWTRRLLATPGMGDWVRFKLDRRTDHILVDESQDTNADQWDIVKALAEEFFAGEGAAGARHRTIFMVGDFKQAIFSFQGTDPREFKRAQDWVRDNAGALRRAANDDEDGAVRLPPEFRELSIDASFRSAPAVLEAVDATIREVGYKTMGLPGPPNPHRAFFADRPGLVELWKPFAAAENAYGDGEAEEGWIGESERLYARELARQVHRWLEAAPTLASTGRRLGAGDILVLVRSRGELAALIVARLFEEGVPVAGIDRLHLHKPLAVKDLLAALTFAVQPLDDLNLANLLVSPLGGWDQQQLYDLAFERKTSLWQALGERAGERPDFAAAREALAGLLAIADFTTPHQYMETVLSGPMNGRRKLYERLGPAARDPIEELLSSALDFERREIASLDRFLAWFARGDVEIKRDPSAPANAVRVMTVHGAKGLEAPVVILADATADPKNLGPKNPPLDFPVLGLEVPVVRPRKAELVPPFDRLVEREKLRDLEEHWRLLYVGMTRAIEHLVIAGIDKARERPEDCWHARAERALLSLGAVGEEDPHWGAALRYRGSVRPGRIAARSARHPPPAPAVPDWALHPAPPEARPPRPLAPSAILEDREAAPPPTPGQRAAAVRGTLIHQLLERLPGVKPGRRRDAALRWLEHSAGLTDPRSREEIAGTACAVLTDARFAKLFGPGSIAEAPIAATLPDGRVIAGTVDRLLVDDECVCVIDYKTGTCPSSAEAVPLAHRAQMAAYRDALAVIFPGRPIRSALLYTTGPRLFEG